MKKMARDGRIHIVLLPHGPLGELVLDVAADWVATGILEPAFWVRDKDVREHQFVPANVTATVMGRLPGGEFEEREVPLLAAIGHEAVDEIILSSIRWIDADKEASAATAQAASRLLAVLQDSLPLSRYLSDQQVEGTYVQSLNVVFAGTQVTSDELSTLLSAAWDENIIVSPEDRQRPRGADRFTDVDDLNSWAGFITASTMSIAGLWTGMSQSPIKRKAGSGRISDVPHVRVARTFSRAVMSDGFSVQLAARIVERLGAPESPLIDDGVSSNPTGISLLDADSADRAIDMGVAYLTNSDSAALSYRRLPEFREDETPTISWWDAQKRFFAFAWDTMCAMPRWTVTAISDRASRKTTREYFGTEGNAVVDARLDLGRLGVSRDLLDPLDAINGVRGRVKAQFEAPPMPVIRVPAPAVWTSLRNVVFTLCDGGSDSPDLKLPEDALGRTQIVDDINLLIPAPGDTWTLPEDVAAHLGESDGAIVLEWAHVNEAREVLAHLSERTDDLQLRLSELQADANRARKDRITAERDLVEARELLEDLSDAVEDERQRNLFSVGGTYA